MGYKGTRRFILNRETDITGISGTGIVAEGVRFTDGTAVLRWLSAYRTTVTHDKGMASVRAIHGHVGNTEIVYLDPDPTCIYCNGSGTSDNYHCLCYGPRSGKWAAGAGNLALRDKIDAEKGY